MQQIYPDDYLERTTTSQNRSDQMRKIHMTRTSRNLLPLYNPPSIESRITLSRTDSHLKLSFVNHPYLQRRNLKNVLRQIVRKLIHAQNFVKELRQYAEQLRGEHMEYKYRHRNLFPLYPDDISYMIWIQFMKFLHCLASVVFPFQIAYQGSRNFYNINFYCIIYY